MEHDSSEQQKKRDVEQAQLSEQVDAANSGVPNVMARLGLGKTTRQTDAQIEDILFDLDHPEWSVRVATLRKLGKLGAQAPVASLVAALNDEHEAVRSAAVRALGNLGRYTPIEQLLVTLNDSSWHVRAASIMALGKQRERVSGEAFIRTLQDSDETVRAAAAWALGKQGERAPLAPLVAALHDPAWSVREAVVLAMGERGGASAVGPLLAARLDEDSTVRAAAETTLHQLYPEIGTTEISDMRRGDVATADRTEPLRDLPFGNVNEAGLNGYGNSQLLSGDVESEVVDSREVERLDGKQQSEKIFSFATFSSPVVDARREQEHQRTKPEKRRRSVLGEIGRVLVAAALLIGIAGSWLGIAQMLRPSSGQIVSTSSLVVSTSAVNNVTWSRDGKQLASVGKDGIRIWDSTSNEQQTPLYVGNGTIGKSVHVLAMNWSSGNLQIVAMVEGQLKLVQVDNGIANAPILLQGLTGQGEPLVAWSANGQRFVIAAKDEDRVQICGVSGICQAPTALTGLTGTITALALSSDGTNIAAASDDSRSRDKNIQVWNMQGELVDPFTNPTYRSSMASPIIALAWSPKNDHLACETNKEQVAVWGRENSNPIPLNSPQDVKLVSQRALSWSPDGKRIASIANSKQVQIWDTISGSLLYTSLSQAGPITDVEWSPDGKHLAVTSEDGTLQIWSIS